MAKHLLYLWVCFLFINDLVLGDEGQAIDSFYDEDDALNWVILSGIVDDDLSAKWDVDEVWDTIDENISTQKGHHAARKCQNIFGQIMCLCQFKRLVGEQHRCRQSTPNEIKRPQMLRSRGAFIRGTNTARVPYNNMAASVRQSPYVNNLNSDRVEAQKEIMSLKEDAMRNDLAAAQIELDNDELDNVELEQLEENFDELMEEEEELLEEEVDDEVGDDLFEKAFESVQDEMDFNDDEYNEYEQGDDALEEYELVNDEYEEEDDDDLANEELIYDQQMIDVLDQAVDVQNDIIDKQGALIEQLERNNAAKEAALDVMNEDESDAEDHYMDDIDDGEDDYDEVDNAFVDVEIDDNDDQFYDNEDAVYDNDDEDVIDGEQNDEYYDNIDDDKALAQEEYDELYDVDGEESEEQYDDQYIDEEFGEENEAKDKDLQEEEAQAMIADTFWGLEIYTIAFMILCSLCVVCYCYKTSCCGYFAAKEEPFTYGHYEQSEFKRVFGNVDDDMDDVEMGKGQNDSDEAEMLHS